MSEPKVQLVDPQGNMSVTGMSAVGVITASSFDGVSNSSATSITGTPDLDVGIVTATSFVGQGKGHAAGLAGTPELNLGVTTATSFVGDATGKAAGLTGTPNLNVGLVTATGFAGNVTGTVTGNVTGLAVSITPGSNLGLGVCTAIQYHGDGSSLTGAASSAYIAQEITATAAETIIDLSDGNLIYYKGNFNTTVGFASTSAAEQIKFIRDADPSYTISYSTGGVDLDGTGDYLSMPTSTDFEFGTGDYTIEFWFYRTAAGQGNIYEGRDGGNTNRILFYVNSANQLSTYINASQNNGSTLNTGRWYHAALSRSSGTNMMFLDGVLQTSWADTVDVDAPSSTFYIGHDPYNDPAQDFEGYLSNFRVIKGTALYTSDFLPPTSTITNITNTVLLCCQSDSSATAATVIPTGSITANGNASASAHTLTGAGNFNATITWPSRITWNNNTAPTLTYNSDASSSAAQIFNFTTVDTGLTYNGWEGTNYNEDASYRLFYWGLNSNGAAGQDNNTPGYSSPVQISGTKWATVDGLSGTSNWLGCIQRDGNTRNTLWTWGYNSDGCLGQGNQTALSSPTQVGTGNDWALFESNMKVGMATKTDGTLWMWGYNNTGNLGQGDKVYQSSPVQVPGTTWPTSGTQQLDTNHTTRAIKTDGTFWTWGWNTMGELAQNDRESLSSPVQVPGSWKSVSGTYYNSFGVRTDGTLWSWGNNSHGSLGQNNQTKYSSPNQIGTNTDWSHLASTYMADFGGAIKTDGTLWLMGYNQRGELGQNEGDGGGTTRYSSPVQVPGSWQTCAFGDNHTMGLKTDGTMWVWGEGSHGTGLNNKTQYSSPVQIGTANDWTTGGAGQHNVYGTRLPT